MRALSERDMIRKQKETNDLQFLPPTRGGSGWGHLWMQLDQFDPTPMLDKGRGVICPCKRPPQKYRRPKNRRLTSLNSLSAAPVTRSERSALDFDKRSRRRTAWDVARSERMTYRQRMTPGAPQPLSRPDIELNQRPLRL
jgi:hypothetical protein